MSVQLGMYLDPGHVARIGLVDSVVGDFMSWGGDHEHFFGP